MKSRGGEGSGKVGGVGTKSVCLCVSVWVGTREEWCLFGCGCFPLPSYSFFLVLM
jgi:hypothetical protein